MVLDFINTRKDKIDFLGLIFAEKSASFDILLYAWKNVKNAI